MAWPQVSLSLAEAIEDMTLISRPRSLGLIILLDSNSLDYSPHIVSHQIFRCTLEAL